MNSTVLVPLQFFTIAYTQKKHTQLVKPGTQGAKLQPKFAQL